MSLRKKELCLVILREHFGLVIESIAKVILEKGPKTLRNLKDELLEKNLGSFSSVNSANTKIPLTNENILKEK